MNIIRLFVAASAAFFIAGTASAQNAGTVTNNAFAIGNGPGQAGYRSLLCGSAQLAVGQAAAAPICQTITGDVTISAGGVTAIGAGKVTNSMLIGTITATLGGTGQSTYLLGDILYASSGTALSKLAGNTTANRRFLRQTGTGSVSAAPVWDALTSADMPAFTGDIAVAAGTTTTTLATVNANVGTFGSSSAVPNFTVNAKGLITAAGSAAYQDGTNAVKGVVRGDGTTISCAAGVCTSIGAAATSVAVGTTTISSGTSGRILYDNAGVLGEFDPAPITNSIASDIAMNNISNYFDGPSVAQGSTGTWFASGSVVLLDTTSSAAGLRCKLWDGTNVVASGTQIPAGMSFPVSIALSGVFTSPPGNIRISCQDFSTTSGVIKANITLNSKDSTVTAYRIK